MSFEGVTQILVQYAFAIGPIMSFEGHINADIPLLNCIMVLRDYG